MQGRKERKNKRKSSLKRQTKTQTETKKPFNWPKDRENEKGKEQTQALRLVTERDKSTK